MDRPTLLPLRTIPGNDTNLGILGRARTIWSTITGRDVAYVPVFGSDKDMDGRADDYAALIVTACNHHAELVEALRACDTALSDDRAGTFDMDDPDYWRLFDAARDAARAILSRIEGDAHD